jgi:hypothetical protein
MNTDQLARALQDGFPDLIWGNPRKRICRTFEFYFDLLQRYVSREGSSLIPADHVEEGVKLGQWVARIRQQRRRPRKLPAIYVAALETVSGWRWTTKTRRKSRIVWRECVGCHTKFRCHRLARKKYCEWNCYLDSKGLHAHRSRKRKSRVSSQLLGSRAVARQLRVSREAAHLAMRQMNPVVVGGNPMVTRAALAAYIDARPQL